MPHADVQLYPFKVLKKAGTDRPVIEVKYSGEKIFVSLRNFRCLFSLGSVRRLSNSREGVVNGVGQNERNREGAPRNDR